MHMHISFAYGIRKFKGDIVNSLLDFLGNKCPPQCLFFLLKVLSEYILHFFKNFSWSIGHLQYCVTFSYTAKCIIYTYTYIHSVFQVLFSYRPLHSIEQSSRFFIIRLLLVISSIYIVCICRSQSPSLPLSEYILKEKKSNNIEERVIHNSTPLTFSLSSFLFRCVHCHQFGMHPSCSLSEHINVLLKACLVFSWEDKRFGLFCFYRIKF